LRSLAAVVLIVSGLALAATPAHAATLPAGFDLVTVKSGFTQPTEVAWAPDGRMFVAEKQGKVRLVTADGTLLPSAILDITAKVNHYSDRGLLGLAVDRDFATNHWLYLLYVAELSPMNPDTGTAAVSRLTRVTVNANNTVSPETTIVGSYNAGPCPAASNTVDCIPADQWWHTIGTVRSDPVDGTLWLGSGDARLDGVNTQTYRVQDERSFAGKILHVDRDGNGLPGHPFCTSDTDLTHACTKVYAKGFRNPYRFELRSGKRPIAGDVGSSYEEEFDLVRAGGNYGWPCYEGSGHSPTYKNEQFCVAEYAKEGTAAAADPPAYFYAHGAGAAAVGGPRFETNKYPAKYQGDIFVGDYAQGWIKHMNVDAQDNVTAVDTFATGLASVVGLRMSPQGDLAVVDIGDWVPGQGSVMRIVYSATNRPPIPVATANPTTGTAPLAVSFDGSGSSDPDNDPLTYDWDFGDGSAHATIAKPAHTYGTPGIYTATLTVDDGSQSKPSTKVTITVGSKTPPVASISAPLDQSSYRDGQLVNLAGSGSDAQDGTLTGTSLQWQVVLHHGTTHTHLVTSPTGTSASFTPFTDHDAESWYEIRLTATDSDGQTGTRTVTIVPETASVAIGSSPPGAPIVFAGAPAEYPAPPAGAAAPRGPAIDQHAIGLDATLTAPASYDYAGHTYLFKTWSDGGAQTHQVSVPSAGSTLIATYEPQGGETRVYTPDADTYVDASQPATSFGTSPALLVDGSPERHSWIRFPVAGIQARPVIAARLALRQADVAAQGGRITPSPAGTWDETFTWTTRPAYGTLLPDSYSFGSVNAGQDYEVALPPGAVADDGRYAYALTSPDADASQWISREGGAPPRLLVDVTCSSTGDPCDPDDDDDGVPDASDLCPTIPAATPDGCPAPPPEPVPAAPGATPAAGEPQRPPDLLLIPDDAARFEGRDLSAPSVSIGVGRRVRRGTLPVRLTCPDDEVLCAGTASAGGAAQEFRTRGGRSIEVRPRLSARALTVIARRGSVRLRLRVDVHDRAGNADVIRLVVRARS
jgi:glucose/arabinose dehydrogenase/PKD repeat protein